MRTEELIRALGADTRRPLPLGRVLILGLGAALALAALAVGQVLGFRSDLAQALVTPVSVLRILLTGTLGLIGCGLALRLARPEARAPLWPLALVGAVALGAWLWAHVTTPEEARQMATVGKTMTTCLVAIPLLSILPVATLHLVLRQGAPTLPRRAGLVAGLGGAGLAAAVYALHCTEDSPLFYVTWYGLAILGVTAVSVLVAGRSLRW